MTVINQRTNNFDPRKRQLLPQDETVTIFFHTFRFHNATNFTPSIIKREARLVTNKYHPM